MSQNYLKDFTYINWFNPNDEEDAGIIPILQTRQRHMEVNEHAQCHPAGESRPKRGTLVSGSAAHALTGLPVTASG